MGEQLHRGSECCGVLFSKKVRPMGTHRTDASPGVEGFLQADTAKAWDLVNQPRRFQSPVAPRLSAQ